MSQRLPLRVRQSPLWWPVLLLSLAIALYGLAYLVFRERMFPPPLAQSFGERPWGILTHAGLSAVALAIGPFQFHRGLLVRRRSLHRRLGMVYVTCALLGGGVTGLYMAAYSFGGWITHAGFGALAVLTGTTTAAAYVKARTRQFTAHREWMIRSFSLLFAAVTLRIWLPILDGFYGSFPPAYAVVSWLCWVPNLLWAEWYVRRSRSVQAPVVRRIAAEASPA